MMERPGIFSVLDFEFLALNCDAKFFAAQSHRENFRLQSLAFARVAELRAHVLLEPVADEFAFAFGREPFEIWQHAFKRTVKFC